LVYQCVAGITPITHNHPIYLDFKQERKIKRLSVLCAKYEPKRNFNTQININNYSFVNKPVMKICGIHNLIDFMSVINSGSNWIGIHCTYDSQDKYLKKLLLNSDIFGYYTALKYINFYKNNDLPIPWAEYDSIKQMISYISKNKIDCKIVVLLGEAGVLSIVRLLDIFNLKQISKKILIQIQINYSKKTIDEIRNVLDSNGYYNIKIIQTIGMDNPISHDLLLMAQKDIYVDYILLDTSIKGGTSRFLGEDLVSLFIEQALMKPVFIAGGVDSISVNTLLKLSNYYNIDLFGFDIESSVEFQKKHQIITKYKSSYVKIRKNPELIKEITNKLFL